MVSIAQEILVEPSTVIHPIEFQIYTQHTKSHPRQFAIFDGSAGEAVDQRHTHFLVHRKDQGDRCIYSVVTLDDASGFVAFGEHIRVVLPGLLPETSEPPSVQPRRRPRTHQSRDEDELEEETELPIQGSFSGQQGLPI
jgi:hypothetical protein